LSAGLHLRPHWQSLQRSPDTLAVFGGPSSKGRGGGKGEGRGGEEERGICPMKKKEKSAPMDPLDLTQPDQVIELCKTQLEGFDF